jgi:hypothetical protein
METAIDPGQTPVTSAEITGSGTTFSWSYFATATPVQGSSSSASGAVSAVLSAHATSNPGHRLFIALDPAVAAALVTGAQPH